MINDDNFREVVDQILNNYEAYSKDDFYNLLLEMTEEFLVELIAAKSLEKKIIDELGEEEGDKVLNEISQTSIYPDLIEDSMDIDIKVRIGALMETVERMHEDG